MGGVCGDGRRAPDGISVLWDSQSCDGGGAGRGGTGWNDWGSDGLVRGGAAAGGGPASGRRIGRVGASVSKPCRVVAGGSFSAASGRSPLSIFTTEPSGATISVRSRTISSSSPSSPSGTAGGAWDAMGGGADCGDAGEGFPSGASDDRLSAARTLWRAALVSPGAAAGFAPGGGAERRRNMPVRSAGGDCMAGCCDGGCCVAGWGAGRAVGGASRTGVVGGSLRASGGGAAGWARGVDGGAGAAEGFAEAAGGSEPSSSEMIRLIEASISSIEGSSGFRESLMSHK